MASRLASKISGLEARQMGKDSMYLANMVGIPLTQCLAELTAAMPADPIEWIAQWLYRYTDNEIYFYEKTIYLKDMYRMKLELDKDNERNQTNRNIINEKIKSTKAVVNTLERQAMKRCGKKFRMRLRDIDSLPMIQAGSEHGSDRHSDKRDSEERRKSRGLRASRHKKTFAMDETGNVDTRGSLQHWVDELSATFGIGSDHRYNLMITKSHERHNSFIDEGEGEGGDHFIPDYLINDEGFGHIKNALEKFSVFLPDYVDKTYLNTHTERLSDVLHILNHVGEANWSLDKKASLVCHHTVLGTMEPRPVFVPPETPEWWEKMGYLECTLYDHEIYSTDTAPGHSPMDVFINKLPRLTYDDYAREARESQRKPEEDSGLSVISHPESDGGHDGYG